MAVPQIPMRCTFDDHAGSGAGNHTRRDAERQREGRSIHVADREAEDDRPRERPQKRGERRQGRGLTARVVAPGERSEHDRGRTGEDPRQLQLREEPIEPVGALGDILDEQDAALWGIERERRPERCGNLRQRSAEDRAGCFAGHECFERWRRQLAQWTRHRDSAQ
jgi:hypothetical protein